MNRELDGCYFRIVRNGVGQSVCFTDLAEEECDTLLADKDTQFLKNLCCYLAERIQELGDIIEEQSKQLLLSDLEAGRTSGEKTVGCHRKMCGSTLQIRKTSKRTVCENG